jgi:hypothetical protein
VQRFTSTRCGGGGYSISTRPTTTRLPVTPSCSPHAYGCGTPICTIIWSRLAPGACSRRLQGSCGKLYVSIGLVRIKRHRRTTESLPISYSLTEARGAIQAQAEPELLWSSSHPRKARIGWFGHVVRSSWYYKQFGGEHESPYGLTACNKHGFSPLHVVEDSSMIIRQHVTRQPPKAKHLQPIYWRSRRQAAGIHILTWQHHLRAYNKMADMLANMAIDSLRSTQLHLGAESLHTERWAPLMELAQGDVGHWTMTNTVVDSLGATVVVP